MDIIFLILITIYIPIIFFLIMEDVVLKKVLIYVLITGVVLLFLSYNLFFNTYTTEKQIVTNEFELSNDKTLNSSKPFTIKIITEHARYAVSDMFDNNRYILIQ